MNSDNVQSTLARKSATTIFLTSLGLGVLFQWIFYGQALGIGALVFVLLLITSLLIQSYVFRAPIPRATWLPIVGMVFFAGMLSLRTSGLLVFWDIFALLYLGALTVNLAANRPFPLRSVLDYVRLFFLPIIFLLQAFPVFSLMSPAKETLKEQHQHLLFQIVRGSLFTLPVLVIFILLFSSADLVFNKYVTEVLHFSIEAETYARILLTVFVAILITGAFGIILLRLITKSETDSPVPLRRFGTIEAGILLGSVATIFGLFLFIQFTYLFGGSETIVDKGFTFADYARRGFFELIWAAVISFFILHTTEQKIVQYENKVHTRLFQTLSALITLEVILVTISAYRRLALYEDAYGFTNERFVAHAFLFWLLVIFGLLLYRLFWDRSMVRFSHLLAASGFLFLGILNLMNPDAFVARQNLQHYRATGKIDVQYLAYLSFDALPQSQELLRTEDEFVRRSFAHYLSYQLFYLDNEPRVWRGWQSWNWSRIRGIDLLQTNRSVLEENENYVPDFVCADPTENYAPVPDSIFPSIECPEGTTIKIAPVPTSLPVVR